VVLKADFEFVILDIVLTQIKIARSEWIEFSYQIQNGVYGFETRVGTKIFRAVFDHFPGRKKSRERFFFDANPRVGFIIPKQNVIARLQGFD
jgi:hypothetical protein